MMLRKRSRKGQSKDQSMLNSASESNFSPTTSIQRNKTSSFFSLPGLFVGFTSKRSSDNDPSRSPTSPLDSKVFSNLGNSFVRSPRWDSDRVGLGIVDSLNDETKTGEVFGLSKSGRNIVFGSQMKINVPNSVTHCQSPLEDSLVTTPRSLPGTFKVPPQNHHIGSPKPQSSLIPVELNPLGKIRSCSNCNDFGSENNKPQVGSPLLIKKGNRWYFEKGDHYTQSQFQPYMRRSKVIEAYAYINENGKNRASTALASLPTSEDGRRRDFLIVGLYALPFLVPRRASAAVVEGLVGDEQDLTSKEASANSYLDLLNGLGIISSGVLGALYAMTKKEEASNVATIESLNTKTREKEAATSILERNFEINLQSEQEHWQKQIRKIKTEEASLVRQLASVSSTISRLRQEVQSEKRLVDDLRGQINVFHLQITQSNEEKNVIKAKLKEKIAIIEVLQERVGLLGLEVKDQEKTIEDLKSLLDEKESQCKDLDSIVEKTKVDLIETSSKAKGLEDEVFKTREVLELKKSKIDELNVKIKLVLEEIDHVNKRIHALHEDYDRLKLSLERKADTDSRHLSKKDSEIHQLDEKLKLALGEASKNHVLISELRKERDNFKSLLEKEMNNVKNLMNTLQITQKGLESSRAEADDLTKQLIESTKSCEEFVLEVSRIQAEFAEVQETLQRNLGEANFKREALSKELVSVKEAMKASEDELSRESAELKEATIACKSLKKEISEVHKRAETATNDLKEERKMVATLKKQLTSSTKQITRDSESRRSLERDLEETSKSLDNMSKSLLLLTKELETVNVLTSSLESEKEMLYNSLEEQKNITKEAKENIEDTQRLKEKLGVERGKWKRKSKKLEKNLLSAEDEILELQMQINASGNVYVNSHPLEEVNTGNETSVNSKHSKKTEEVTSMNSDSVVPKKTSRRRKKGSA
ncbi:MAR-binding filament-like protein 1 [Acorus gramineus]|uniref:MAR-binding filament-like protein 1 n=1 Tax=Acorus gramineus TaxID=55184 RepID=A0AAV9A724_ACOGR|nr:MAR-binding filament-like protein 1 [Acorus gramineus]